MGIYTLGEFKPDALQHLAVEAGFMNKTELLLLKLSRFAQFCGHIVRHLSGHFPVQRKNDIGLRRHQGTLVARVFLEMALKHLQ